MGKREILQELGLLNWVWENLGREKRDEYLELAQRKRAWGWVVSPTGCTSFCQKPLALARGMGIKLGCKQAWV